MSAAVVVAVVVTAVVVLVAVRLAAADRRSVRRQCRAGSWWQATGSPVPGWHERWIWSGEPVAGTESASGTRPGARPALAAEDAPAAPERRVERGRGVA